MDLNHLKVFHAVAQSGGFTRAQRTLGVQQPAISKAVKALEDALGVDLFERSRAGAALTTAGERLLQSCEVIFQELERTRGSLDSRGVHGDLRIATNEHGAAYVFPSVISECRRLHPRLVPRVVTGASHMLLREIVDGRAELGVLFFLERSALLDRRELAKVPCQLVVKKGHAKDRAVIERFIGSRELDDLGNKGYPTLRMLQAARPKTEIAVSCNSLEAHKALVKAGAGVSILPLFMVQDELKRSELEILHPEYVYVASIELVTKRNKVLSRPAKAFVQLLKRQLTSQMAR